MFYFYCADFQLIAFWQQHHPAVSLAVSGHFSFVSLMYGGNRQTTPSLSHAAVIQQANELVSSFPAVNIEWWIRHRFLLLISSFICPLLSPVPLLAHWRHMLWTKTKVSLLSQYGSLIIMIQHILYVESNSKRIVRTVHKCKVQYLVTQVKKSPTAVGISVIWLKQH